jgi:menaquinol-cytochrome c reductase cytochrome b/c subunit
VNATTDSPGPPRPKVRPRRDAAAAATDPRRFFPDLFVIEAAVALGMLVALVVVAALTSTPLEEAASRDAAGYVPRPEWYFLWFFQLLKYFKGSLEPIGTVLVPVLAIGLLLAVPFIDRRPVKTKALLGRTRPIRLTPRLIALVVVALLLTLTVVAASTTEGGAGTPAPTIPEWPPQSRVYDDAGGAAAQSLILCGPRGGIDA